MKTWLSCMVIVSILLLSGCRRGDRHRDRDGGGAQVEQPNQPTPTDDTRRPEDRNDRERAAHPDEIRRDQDTIRQNEDQGRREQAEASCPRGQHRVTDPHNGSVRCVAD